MLKDAKVMSFVATVDLDRARNFYENILGLTFLTEEPYALVFDCHGSLLRVSPVVEIHVAPYTVLGWEVADIESQIGELSAKGVVFEQFEGVPQADDGVCTFPNGDRVAWFKDPDGNLLSIAQFGSGHSQAA